MGQPKLSPDVLKLSARYPAGVLGNPKPIAQRFAHTADLRQSALCPAEPPRASPSEESRAAAHEATAPAGGPSGRTRWLHAGLILAALFPSLILAALWLGLVSLPRPTPTVPLPQARTASPSTVLTAPDRIEAIAGEDVSFPIALDGTDGVPSRSVIAVRGLPQGSNFSEGRPYGDSEWSLKPDQIGDLDLALPAGANGEFKLGIALIGPDDRVIAEAETLLEITAAPPAPAAEESSVPSPDSNDAASSAPVPDGSDAAAPTLVPDGAPGDEAGVEQKPTTPKAATSLASEPATVGPSEDAESGLGSVQPSVYVNLREGPSSSASVVGVIAKGAKLSVLDRKRGWVQVADPATDKKGWIYSGNLVGEAKTHHSRGKRAAPAETAPASESFWGRIGEWLSPS
jgi:hypothetical protein